MDPSTLENVSKGLESSLDFWGALLLGATFVVVLGLIFEYRHSIGDFFEQWRRPAAAFPSKTFVELLGAILVTVGVAGELFFTFMASRAETRLRENTHKIEILLTKEAGDAKVSAVEAANAAGRADSESEQATAASSSAITLARGARKEADSFERDIAASKQQAADAESHLAGALQRAAQAEAALYRIKSPRSFTLTPVAELSLNSLKGTKYVFASVGQDEDSINLLIAIDTALQKSGWIRDKSIGGFPGINPYGHADPDFAVPVGFDSGVHVSVEWTEDVGLIRELPRSLLPKHLQAANGLIYALSLSISPPTENTVRKDINVDSGTSHTIKIFVGRKPLE